jgi:hypothetical protein
VLYSLIALLVFVVLITRPFLVVLAFLLVGYGRYYHFETTPSHRLPWPKSPDRGVIRLGPATASEPKRHGGLHDLANLKGPNVSNWNLNFPPEKKGHLFH